MILAIDIGNSNIVLGVYEDRTLQFVARMQTHARRTADEYAVLMHDALALHGAQAAQIGGAIISSVVPALSDVFSRAVQLLCGVVPLQVGPGIRTGLNIKIDDPGQLGADLCATAIGAIEKYPLPAVIIDLGTATKVTAVDKGRAFLGGAIMPGVVISLEALSSRTAQLPHIGLGSAGKLKCIGTNTVECMQAGVILGAASMLDGLIERCREEMGEVATVVACGGLVQAIVPYCRSKIVADENLLLDGLIALYHKNVG